DRSAPSLLARLREHGAHATHADGTSAAPAGPLDAVILLAGPVLPDAFPLLKDLLRRGPRHLLCVRPTEGDGRSDAIADGMGGFLRT
ncbi:hypothetical protein, partial [Streptomyces sp. URMC 129]